MLCGKVTYQFIQARVHVKISRSRHTAGQYNHFYILGIQLFEKQISLYRNLMSSHSYTGACNRYSLYTKPSTAHHVKR